MSQFQQCTEVFLKRDNQVLVGYKKTGLGQGNYLGIGGKVEPGETILEGAIREVEEEIGVCVSDLHQVGDFTFLFPHQPDWSQQVHVFFTESWTGEIRETAEMRPHWFDSKAIPHHQMWDDSQFWLPDILQGKKLMGKFIFDTNLKVVSNQLKAKNF